MDEIRRGFHHDLDVARQEITRIAALVIEAIPRATQILLDQDLEGAEHLIMANDEIDARSIELEERCYQMLALQQPVAGDLRQIIAAIKIISELERSADLCVNICKAARRIYGHPLDPKLRGIITKMGEQAQVLYREAMESYATNDAARAAAIDDMDSYLDDLQRQFIQAIFECHAVDRVDLQVAVQLALVARFYERIGDHAVNVGERVRYLATGWMPEHEGARRHQARAISEEPSSGGSGAPAADGDGQS